MSIRVVLVDDHLLFREALRTLLESTSNIEVVGESSDPTQIAEIVEQLAPDVVVMDVSRPRPSAIELTRVLVAKHPKLRVVALSAYFEKQVVLDMFDAGALAYVVKSDAGHELVRAIFSVSQGRRFLCAEAAGVQI